MTVPQRIRRLAVLCDEFRQIRIGEPVADDPTVGIGSEWRPVADCVDEIAKFRMLLPPVLGDDVVVI
jgi:hypothetical protein